MKRTLFTTTGLPARAVWMGILFACVLLAGCAGRVGPRSVPAARFNYNEAIVRSRNEQLLLNLVRLRYRDTPLFLDFGSIVTQYELGGRAGASPIINIDGSDWEEFGFDVGVNYSERPTITYSPLQGVEFTQRLLTPVAPHTIILLSESGWSIERLLLCCVQRINDLKNAPGAAGPTPSYVPRNDEFQQLASVLRRLQIAGVLNFQLSFDPKESATLVHIEETADPAWQADIRQVRGLLGLPEGRSEFRLTSEAARRREDEIAMTGRSLLGVLFFLSQTVDSPPPHEQQGLVTITKDAAGERFDWTKVTGDLLRIRSGAERPARGFARVRYRGHWFYIDDSDLNSKATFSLLTYLFSLQAAGGQGVSPLLTVPVGN